MKPKPYDTGVKPPGGDVGGSTPPDRGQSRNSGGFGAGQDDLKRGHVSIAQPEVYEDPHPQKRMPGDGPQRGFTNRSPFSDER